MSTDRTTLGRIAILLLVGLAALAVGRAADARPDSEADRPLVVKLSERHDSGVSGTVTLSPARKGVRVLLRVNGRARDVLPAHIHTGPCRREPTFANPRIYASLTSVANGRSVTTVAETTLRALRATRFSINVHSPGYSVIACADIPRAS
jgi:hypothetical protein